MGEVVDVLRAAEALLRRPEAWLRGAWAADARGNLMWAGGDSQVCWCLAGAIHNAHYKREGFTYPTKAIRYMARAIGGWSEDDVLRWNDSNNRTHAEVRQALRKAIRLALREGVAP